MEASGEPFGFFAHDCQKEFPSFFWLFCAQVLNVDLCRFVTKLDFHFGATRAHPKEHLITRVKDHDIIMSKVILQKNYKNKKCTFNEEIDIIDIYANGGDTIPRKQTTRFFYVVAI